MRSGVNLLFNMHSKLGTLLRMQPFIMTDDNLDFIMSFTPSYYLHLLLGVKKNMLISIKIYMKMKQKARIAKKFPLNIKR